MCHPERAPLPRRPPRCRPLTCLLESTTSWPICDSSASTGSAAGPPTGMPHAGGLRPTARSRRRRSRATRTRRSPRHGQRSRRGRSPSTTRWAGSWRFGSLGPPRTFAASSSRAARSRWPETAAPGVRPPLTTPGTGSRSCVRSATARRWPGRAGARRPDFRGSPRCWPGRAAFDALASAVAAPVLVVHARDDHHVPVDFALAAVARHPAWQARLLGAGGHHAHVRAPGRWLSAVEPWLRGLEEPVGHEPRATEARHSSSQP
jgi:hypothetical protein